MLLVALAYLAGVLTIVSPCILPVLPFVLAHANRPFLRAGLPMLIGMALAFAAVASLAAIAGGWAIAVNRHGRTLALALIALFELTLLFPVLSARLMAPLVGFGEWPSRLANERGRIEGAGGGAPALLGVATGLLWAPCAGPILGIILAGAALGGPGMGTSLLLLAYSAGAATSLALVLLVGGRIFAMMKRSIGLGEGLRRVLGAAVLVSVAAIALGLDTGLLTRMSSAGTVAIEQRVIALFNPPQDEIDGDAIAVISPAQAEGKPMPPLFGAMQWLNTPPLTAESIEGKVALVNFWTYSCINCLRSLPYVRAWAEKYKDRDLVVIGVHTPEFAFEKDLGNVHEAAAALGVSYPIAIDNSYAIWRSFDNQAWPALYLIDARGRTRHLQLGEGDFAAFEGVIQNLLAESGNVVEADTAKVVADGVEGAADLVNLRSSEAYIGYARARGFVSSGGMREDVPNLYSAASKLRLNQWSLSGIWTVAGDYSALDQAGGRIIHRFHARDLHLVLGPSPDGKPIRFRVTIDGVVPGPAHGLDCDNEGLGAVTAERLYQLVRQNGAIRDRSFEIEFLDPGVRAYAFTFG